MAVAISTEGTPVTSRERKNTGELQATGPKVIVYRQVPKNQKSLKRSGIIVASKEKKWNHRPENKDQ